MQKSPLSTSKQPTKNRPTFRAWEESYLANLTARGTYWSLESYPRPEAGGKTVALRLTPPGPLRGRIIVAHGTGNDLFFPQLGIFDVCLDAGLEVFAFDLDGHGRHSTTVLSEEGARSMIPAAIAQAQGQDTPRDQSAGGSLPLYGLGISLGGTLWLHAASRDGASPLRALILLTTPLNLHLSPAALAAEVLTILRPDFWRQRHRYGGLRGAIPAFGPYRREHFPLRLGAFPSLDLPLTPASYPIAVRHLIATLARETAPRRILSPTLIVQGTADLLVPRADAERLQRELSQPHLVLISKGTHFTTPFEARTETALGAFLRDMVRS